MHHAHQECHFELFHIILVIYYVVLSNMTCIVLHGKSFPRKRKVMQDFVLVDYYQLDDIIIIDYYLLEIMKLYSNLSASLIDNTQTLQMNRA